MNTYALSRQLLHATIKLPGKPRKDRPPGVLLQPAQEPNGHTNE